LVTWLRYFALSLIRYYLGRVSRLVQEKEVIMLHKEKESDELADVFLRWNKFHNQHSLQKVKGERAKRQRDNW